MMIKIILHEISTTVPIIITTLFNNDIGNDGTKDDSDNRYDSANGQDGGNDENRYIRTIFDNDAYYPHRYCRHRLRNAFSCFPHIYLNVYVF